MTTPYWVEYLRTNTDAWDDCLAWLDAASQAVKDKMPKTWEDELRRQGERIALDNIKHKVTLDQKEAAALATYREVTSNGSR